MNVVEIGKETAAFNFTDAWLRDFGRTSGSATSPTW